MNVPDDLKTALRATGVLETFDAMSPSHRREWIDAVNDAKRPQTRKKRIADCIAAMRERS